MRIALEVEYRDGSVGQCVADYPDLVAFEEKFDRSVLKLNTELKLRDLGFLAWHALRRDDKTSKDFDEWTIAVAIVRATDEDVDIVPLEQ